MEQNYSERKRENPVNEHLKFFFKLDMHYKMVNPSFKKHNKNCPWKPFHSIKTWPRKAG